MILVSTKKLTQLARTLAASLLVVTPLLCVPVTVSAAGTLSTRSVQIGSSTQGATTTNIFKFTYPGYSNVGSIEIEYCGNTPFAGTPCDTVPGLNVSSAALTSQTGETGFSIFTPTSPNKIILTRNASPTNALPSTYSFSNIVNPSEANKTVYVRVSTLENEDGTGSRTDEGSVVFSTATNISVSGYVPPYLTFCVGVTVEINCSSASGNQLDFGELVPSRPRALTSQYSGATNDPGGFSTFVNGATMTSGNNIIPSLDSPRQSQPGTGQFGMNLRANSNPGIGAEPAGSGTSAPVGQFGSPNLFFFNSQLASTSPLPTDFNRFTASYLVNVPGNQAPGIYNTTLTYIATAAF